MSKCVVLMTGTPGVGKTTVAKALVSQLDAQYVNLTELAEKEGLVVGIDRDRDTIIINEVTMKQKMRELIETSDKQNIVVDGHYAAIVVPKELVTRAFVLRRYPVELKAFMEKAGFAGRKLWENMTSEILDVCLVDTLNAVGSEKVCELDVSGKSVAETVAEVLAILKGERECHIGVVDWLGKLENEGLLDELLKV